MSAEHKYDLSEIEMKYYDITELYEQAEELIDTVEDESVKHKKNQIDLIEPLVETIGESADVLSESFLEVNEEQMKDNAKLVKKTKSKKIEQAFRKLYLAIDKYNKDLNEKTKDMANKTVNIATVIVEKIKRQIEVIIGHFIDFVDLSLEHIMQKTQLEELKMRQEKISVILHQASQSQDYMR